MSASSQSSHVQARVMPQYTEDSAARVLQSACCGACALSSQTVEPGQLHVSLALGNDCVTFSTSKSFLCTIPGERRALSGDLSRATSPTVEHIDPI
jgi:hypothetical protein